MHRIRALIVLLLSVLIWSFSPTPILADYGFGLSASSGSSTQTSYDNNDPNATIFRSTIVVGNFTVVSAMADSNLPGSPNVAFNEDNNFKITNTGSSAASITIAVSASGFTSPSSPPPLYLSATASVSVLSGTLNSISMEAFLFTASDGTTYFSSSAAGSNVVSGTDITGSASSLSHNQSESINLNSSPFDLDGSYGLTWLITLDLAAGAQVTMTGGNASVYPTPAPGGFALSLVALPILGFALLRQRRKSQLVSASLV